MSCILNIETSTTVCSVAASQDGQTIFVKEDLKGPSHAVSLGVFRINYGGGSDLYESPPLLYFYLFSRSKKELEELQ